MDTPTTVWLTDGTRLFHVNVGSEVEANLLKQGFTETTDPNAKTAKPAKPAKPATGGDI